MTPTFRTTFLLTLAAQLLMVANCSADLVVNEDLGVLPFGTINVFGDTASGANNADIYAGTPIANANWGNEYVYQFSTSAAGVLSLTLHDASDDPDFFLLDGLATAPLGNKRAAQNDLASLFLDFGFPDTDFFGLIPAGTYYLSVDAFSGFDPPPAIPASSTFDLDITLSAIEVPADFLDLGTIAQAGMPFSVDTFGSSFDTVLGIYDNSGLLLDINDDADGTFQSLLEFPAGLAAGQYFLGLGGFFTSFGDGFVVLPDFDSEGGDFVLNYPGGSTLSAVGEGEFQWLRFEVAVPEPSTWALLVVGGVVISIWQRRAGSRTQR